MWDELEIMLQTRKVVCFHLGVCSSSFFFIHTLPCCLCLTLSSSALSLSLWCNRPDYCSIHPFQYANHLSANCLSAALIKLSDTYRKCASKPLNPPPEECDVLDDHCNIVPPEFGVTCEGICSSKEQRTSTQIERDTLCILTLLLNVLIHSFLLSF